ncbi:DUF58 domain-containing protein [Hydrogenophaga soli]
MTCRHTGMRWRQRFDHWLAERRPRTDQLTLTQRNVYILPTRAGWMTGITLLAMLVGSINYQLNLGYLLTFLLAGAAAVGLHVCHANLRGLQLRMATPPACFLGHPVRMDVSLQHTSPRDRPGIALRVVDHTEDAWVDVPAQGSTTAQLSWMPPRRGRLPLPTVHAETRFPLGMFRAWTVWRPAALAWVYPQPEANPPALPPGQPHAGSHDLAHSAPSGEHDGVRAYRRGDPLKTIVWKRVAQAMARGSADLVSREQVQAPQQSDLWLDWQHTGLTQPEARLSRLTAWVLMADRLGLIYGLRLPGTERQPDWGPTHRQACLEALALC